MSNITLYRHPLSGHSHRRQLLLSLLDLDAELVDVDLAAGEHKQEPFLAMSKLQECLSRMEGADSVASPGSLLVEWKKQDVYASLQPNRVPARIQY